jgi:large subunit ribosomal protein L35
MPGNLAGCGQFAIFAILKKRKMPKMKTNSSAKKRFSLTGTGKIKRKHAYKRHILTKKEKDRKRGLAKSGLVSAADTPNVKFMLGI